MRISTMPAGKNDWEEIATLTTHATSVIDNHRVAVEGYTLNEKGDRTYYRVTFSSGELEHIYRKASE